MSRESMHDGAESPARRGLPAEVERSGGAVVLRRRALSAVLQAVEQQLARGRLDGIAGTPILGEVRNQLRAAIEDSLAGEGSAGVSEGQRGSELDRPMRGPDARPMPSSTLTYDEAAAVAGVSRSTLKRWVACGGLVAIRVGGVRRIRPADLESFLAGQVA